jgi:hypothetical protein
MSMTFRRLWKNYNLSIVLALLFIFSWALHAVFHWQVYVDEAHAHAQPVQVGDFLNEFFSTTFENWQSEFLQLLTFVILTSFLIHRGSHESKDEDQKMEKMLKEITRKIDELGHGPEPKARAR